MKGLILIPLVASLLATSARAASGRYTLNGHVPKIVSELQPVGRLEASQRLHLTIGLASRDEQGLDTFIKELYDPGSANYRRYLSPKQFTEKFGPAEQDYQTVIDFAKTNGLNVTHQYSNRVVLDVEGAAADIEKALQVTLHTYQRPTEARTFFAPDSEPSLPLGVRVLHIDGLNNYARPHPRHVRRARAITSKLGSAPGGGLWGNDYRRAYVPGTTLTGAGQSIGLVEFETYYPSDITDYENAIGMSASTRPQLVDVQVGYRASINEAGDDGEECSLDIELSLSMAPGLSSIYVFEDGADSLNNSDFDDVFESMISHTNVLQFSCSWGGSTDADPTSETLFKEMAAQGQSFYDASGDNGAFVGPIEFPSDSPSITQVGGTTLTDGGAPSYPWESEIVWAVDSGPTVPGSMAASSSGGISTYYGIPDYQTNISMRSNLGSTNMRNTPDVAANANNVYAYTDDGQAADVWEGTSCAAPLWAGLTAMMNQQAAASNLPPVGFLNPALYAIASRPDYTRFFHDITIGNNTWAQSPTRFYAKAGYDLCCGIGSINGTNLINAIVVPAVTLLPFGNLKVIISPASAIAAGAKWQVDGGKFMAGGATVSNIPAGDHTVSFNTLSGWETPGAESVAIDSNTTTTASGTYVAIGSLKATIAPALAIKDGAQWSVDDGPLQNSGATVPNLPAGNHIVSFSVISGWTAPANRTVSIKTGSLTQITGSYTFSGAGVYNGLFMQPTVTEETAGMLSGLTVTTLGTYSGRLLLAGGANIVTGAFNASGQASNYVARTAKQGGPVALQMTLNWNDSPPNITGAVSGNIGGAWVANLTNELALRGVGSAEYTALISPLPGTPPGDGYILITNHAGAVTLTGSLADGTAFNQAVALSGNGDLPVYRPLYGNTGLLFGWIGLESRSPSGELAWIKPALLSSVRYPDGFTNTVSVEGSPWTNPPPHAATIDLPSGALEISGGSLLAPLTFNVAVSNNNALIKLSGPSTNSLTGSINPKTGLLTITFGNGAGKATTTGFGAILQPTTNGGGFFLGKTNAGMILLQPPF